MCVGIVGTRAVIFQCRFAISRCISTQFSSAYLLISTSPRGRPPRSCHCPSLAPVFDPFLASNTTLFPEHGLHLTALDTPTLLPLLLANDPFPLLAGRDRHPWLLHINPPAASFALALQDFLPPPPPLLLPPPPEICLALPPSFRRPCLALAVSDNETPICRLGSR